MNTSKIVFQRQFELTEWDDAWEIESVSVGPREQIVITAVTRIDPALRANPDQLIQAFNQQRRRYLVLASHGEKSQSVYRPRTPISPRSAIWARDYPIGGRSVPPWRQQCRDRNQVGRSTFPVHVGAGGNHAPPTPSNKT